MKRVLFIADMHCGHLVGLTPPDFDRRPQHDSSHPQYKMWRRRRRCYKFFADLVEELQPIDVLLVNGDCIDGKGKKSGGTELLTTDRDEQCDMATALIKDIKAKDIAMTYGTPYHTGAEEDWETQIAKNVNAREIESVGDVSVNGVLINYRHYASRSSIPHGRFTPLAKERLWNVLWNERGEYPKADLVVRSHVHYHTICGEPGNWLAFTTPALQPYWSKFGARRVLGTVDFGLLWFDIEDKGEITWDSRLLRFKRAKADVLQF